MSTFYVLLAVSFLFWGIIGMIGRNIRKKMQTALLQNDWQKFEKLNSSFMRRISLSSTKVLYLSLNYALSKDSSAIMDKLYDQIADIRLSKSNMQKIYPLMFQYYLEKENKPKCKSLLASMKDVLPDPQVKEMQTLFHIIVEKGIDYIDDMLMRVHEAPDQEKGMLYYLIAKQYGNQKKKTEREQYLKEALKYSKNTPFEQIVAYELKQSCE